MFSLIPHSLGPQHVYEGQDWGLTRCKAGRCWESFRWFWRLIQARRRFQTSVPDTLLCARSPDIEKKNHNLHMVHQRWTLTLLLPHVSLIKLKLYTSSTLPLCYLHRLHMKDGCNQTSSPVLHWNPLQANTGVSYWYMPIRSSHFCHRTAEVIYSLWSKVQTTPSMSYLCGNLRQHLRCQKKEDK